VQSEIYCHVEQKKGNKEPVPGEGWEPIRVASRGPVSYLSLGTRRVDQTLPWPMADIAIRATRCAQIGRYRVYSITIKNCPKVSDLQSGIR
jgi:hypothetical protein